MKNKKNKKEMKLKDICDNIGVFFIEDRVNEKAIYIGIDRIIMKGKAKDFQ